MRVLRRHNREPVFVFVHPDPHTEFAPDIFPSEVLLVIDHVRESEALFLPAIQLGCADDCVSLSWSQQRGVIQVTFLITHNVMYAQ